MAQITPAQMRQNFPEFANQTRFPTGLIQFWLNWSYLMLNACRFGAALDMAAQLMAAHNIAIERSNMDQAAIAAANNAGSIGGNVGVVNSKSVDKVSVAYDAAIAADPNAGYWNLTNYGLRLWQLIQMFGAGPVQIGAGGPLIWYNLVAWPGFWGGWLGY